MSLALISPGKQFQGRAEAHGSDYLAHLATKLLKPCVPAEKGVGRTVSPAKRFLPALRNSLLQL